MREGDGCTLASNKKSIKCKTQTICGGGGSSTYLSNVSYKWRWLHTPAEREVEVATGTALSNARCKRHVGARADTAHTHQTMDGDGYTSSSNTNCKREVEVVLPTMP